MSTEHTLQIEGMTCASCATRVEKALGRVPGVLSASVNLATEKARIRFAPPATLAAFTEAVAGAGYGATAAADSDAPARSDSNNGLPAWSAPAIAGLLTLPLVATMSTGTDVAMHAAGITIMRGDPRLVADAIDISRRTRLKIRQNLFWAFMFNTIGIPLAALGMLSPMVAGAAMAFSSVSVVTNALLLRRWRPATGGAN